MKTWMTYAWGLPSVVMVAGIAAAEERGKQYTPAELVAQVCEQMIQDGVLSDESEPASFFHIETDATLLDHLNRLRSGEEIVSDFDWMNELFKRYGSDEDREVPVELVNKLLDAGVKVNNVSNADFNLLTLARRSTEAAKVLIAAGVDVNEKGKSNTFPLTAAVSCDNVELVKVLLAAGAEPNRKNKTEIPPLMVAAGRGNAEICRLLLAAGANVNAMDDVGDTPISYAMDYSKRSVFSCPYPPPEGALHAAKLLLEAGAKVNASKCPPLREACFFGRVDDVKKLLGAGAKVNQRFADGYTPLGVASQMGHAELIDVLIEAGAEVNYDEDKISPLYLACFVGQVESAKRLLAAGAKVNTPANGASTLHVALNAALRNKSPEAQREEDYLTLVDMLLAAGADPNESEFGVVAPICLAMQANKPDLMKKLLSAGAKTDHISYRMILSLKPYQNTKVMEHCLEAVGDINAQDTNGETMLHAAIRGNKPKVCEWLIAHGADVNACNKEGNPPLYEAICNTSKRKLCRLLLEAGADVNLRNRNGDAMVVVAVKSSDKEVAEMMLASGVNLNDEEGIGQELFNEAVSSGYADICKKLVDMGVKPRRWRALHVASITGQVDTVKQILNSGKKVDQLFKARTALTYAARVGQVQTMQALIEGGADVNFVSSDEWSPLKAAIKAGHMEACRLLLEAGADVHHDSQYIFYAVYKKNIEITKLLIKYGAEVNVSKEYSGDTPLHVAVRVGCVPLVAALIESGANVNAQDNMGNTPLHEAIKSGARSLQAPICQLLINAGADVKLRNERGETPQFIAEQGSGCCVVIRGCFDSDSF